MALINSNEHQQELMNTFKTISGATVHKIHALVHITVFGSVGLRFGTEEGIANFNMFAIYIANS